MKTFNIFFVIIAVLVTTTGFSQDNLHKSFKVKKGDNLSAKVMGEIKVSTWDKDEVDIIVEGIDTDENSGLTIEQADNTVTIAIDNHHSMGGDCTFIISVPKEFNISLSTIGGDIQLEGELTGTVKATTAGGEIKIGTCNGKVVATTAGGDIISGNINGDATFCTAGGEIKTGNINGEAAISTASGDVVVGNIGKSATISTAGGNIHTGNIGNEIKASTMGGDIAIGKVGGKMKVSSAGGDIHVEGAKEFSKISTAGGDIALNDIHGSVQASTAGGDVSVQLFPSGNDESKLASAAGKITLSLPADAKVTLQTQIKGWISENSTGKVISEFTAESITNTREGRKNQSTININGGGPVIQLHTVNSDIEIKKIVK